MFTHYRGLTPKPSSFLSTSQAFYQQLMQRPTLKFYLMSSYFGTMQMSGILPKFFHLSDFFLVMTSCSLSWHWQIRSDGILIVYSCSDYLPAHRFTSVGTFKYVAQALTSASSFSGISTKSLYHESILLRPFSLNTSLRINIGGGL